MDRTRDDAKADLIDYNSTIRTPVLDDRIFEPDRSSCGWLD
jgi:hypothetical protein